MKTTVTTHENAQSVNATAARGRWDKSSLKATLIEKFKKRIARLTRTISRLTSQRDFWKRRVLTPRYEAKRKAKWRADNPAKYRRELRRCNARARARTRMKRAARNATRAGTTGN